MKKLIWFSYLLITIKNCFKLFVRLNVLQNCDRRIVLLHKNDISEEDRFIKQIENCSKNWNFINPNKIDLGKSGVLAPERRELILALDDGFSSDFMFAQNVLDSRSINWERISILGRQGHTIGGHSSSNKRLSNIFDEDELVHEIVNSRQMIEKMISKKVEHFAFPFGNLSSVSSGALQLARENNKYVCSGLRGSNYEIPTESVLRYETLHPWDPMVIESAVLNSTGDPRCRDALSVLDYWCQDILVEVKL